MKSGSTTTGVHDTGQYASQVHRRSLAHVWQPAHEGTSLTKLETGSVRLNASMLEEGFEKDETVNKLSKSGTTMRQTRRHDRRFSWAMACYDSTYYVLLMGLLVVLSCIFVVCDVQGALPKSVIIDIVEGLLAVAFLVDFCLKLMMHGRRGLLHLATWLHLLMVTLSWVVVIVSVASGGSTRKSRPWTERLLRVFRILWAIRLSRVVSRYKGHSVCSELHTLLHGMRTSAQTLVSALVLIILTVYVFGVGAVYAIGEADYSGASAEALEAQSNFESLGKAMLALVRFMHADNAQDILDALQEQQPYIWVYTWLFTALTAFVLMNLVTAVIVEQALRSTQDDKKWLAALKVKDEARAMAELEAIFHALDTDGSTGISCQEFEELFQRDEMREKLAKLGIKNYEPRKLFELVDVVHDGMLSTEEFIKGMRAVRGQASSKDLLLLTSQLQRVAKETQSLQDEEAAKPMQDLSTANILKRVEELKAQVHKDCDALEVRLQGLAAGLQDVVDLSNQVEVARREKQVKLEAESKEKADQALASGSHHSKKEDEKHRSERRKEGDDHSHHKHREREEREARRARRHREQARKDREERERARERARSKEREAEAEALRRHRMAQERAERFAERAEKRYHQVESEPSPSFWGQRLHPARRGRGHRDDEYFRRALEEVRQRQGETHASLAMPDARVRSPAGPTSVPRRRNEIGVVQWLR